MVMGLFMGKLSKILPYYTGCTVNGEKVYRNEITIDQGDLAKAIREYKRTL
jgi:hypothetical protein